jgi:type I restriction enzyme S subunit
MRRYPEYKESGVEWIGEIPKHWEAKRLKYIADLNMGQSPPSEDYNEDRVGTPFLQGNAEFGPYHPIPKIYCPTASKYASPGDILLSVRAPVGAINVADQEYGIGRGLCAIRPRPNQLERDYAKYLLEVVRTELYVVANGTTYDGVTVAQVSNTTCVVPPFSEQTQIANFLNRKTEQIDELLRIKARRVELLHEQRTVLIHQTVTKGLSPNVELKPSGVEYIGDIPKDWEISVVKHVGTSNPSRNNPKTNHLKDEPVVFLPMERVHTDGTIDQELRMSYSQLKSVYTYFEENDILIAKVTPCFENGKIVLIRNLATPVGFGSTEFIVIRPNPKKVFPPFLYYTVYNAPLRTIGKHFMTGAVGLKRVPTRFVENFRIPIPTYQEQTEIANFLDRKTRQIDELRSNEQRSVELLKEYRRTLISEVVTGKIDIQSVDSD